MWSLKSFRSSNPRPPHATARRWALEALEGRTLLSGLPTLSIGDATVTEGNDDTRSAEVVVSLSKPSNKTVTVSYGTADGTAFAGSDYVAASGKLSFAPGQTTQTIRVAVTGDRLVEPDESFSVNISGVKNAKIADATGLVTIVDDEPRITIGSVAGSEGGGGTITFTVSLSAPYDQVVTVDYATRGGTAIAGEDYVATFGTLTFEPGKTTMTFTVGIIGDDTLEPDETFAVYLSNAFAYASILTSQGDGYIYADDGYYDDVDYGGGYYSDPWSYWPGYYWY